MSLSDGKVVALLGEGSIIGEVAFYGGGRRTANVVAKTWCDFATLEKEDFTTVASRFVAQANRIECLAHARIARDGLRLHLKDCHLFTGTCKEFLHALADSFKTVECSKGATIHR